jgi:hypothetical protein
LVPHFNGTAGNAVVVMVRGARGEWKQAFKPLSGDVRSVNQAIIGSGFLRWNRKAFSLEKLG